MCTMKGNPNETRLVEEVKKILERRAGKVTADILFGDDFVEGLIDTILSSCLFVEEASEYCRQQGWKEAK